jgi:hypothetical protein
LKPYRLQLESRATKQEWYELQQPQAKYTAQFAGGKIIYPIIASDARFCLNRNGSYINNRAFAIPCDDLYLLGVLNSKSFWSIVQATCSPLRGGYFELLGNYLAKFPIPVASKAEASSISALVERCLTLDAGERTATEQEIDIQVGRLYSAGQKGSK